MKVPTIEKFLCVFDLRLGALMLGYLGTISNATYALLLLIDLTFDPEELKEAVLEKLNRNEDVVDKINPTPLDEKKITTSCKFMKV